MRRAELMGGGLGMNNFTQEDIEHFIQYNMRAGHILTQESDINDFLKLEKRLFLSKLYDSESTPALAFIVVAPGSKIKQNEIDLIKSLGGTAILFLSSIGRLEAFNMNDHGFTHELVEIERQLPRLGYSQLKIKNQIIMDIEGRFNKC